MIRLLVISLSLISYNVFGQCCGGCSPIGGNTNMGTLPRGMLQINYFTRHANSGGYQEYDHASNFQYVKNANSNFNGLQLSYGFFKRFTADIETGYYINRTQNIDVGYFKTAYQSHGFSYLNFSGRYNIYKDTVNDFEFTASAGIKTPVTRTPFSLNGVELGQDIQPSNGAYGAIIRSFLFKEFDNSGIRIFMINTFNLNGKNLKDYHDGNTFVNAFFISKSVGKNITPILQIRHEQRGSSYQYNTKINNTGGYRFLLVPQINYTIKQKFNISLLSELPIYQYYFGTQLKDKISFSINLNLRIGKQSQECKTPAKQG